MSNHNFLLTYSVSPRNANYEEKADKIRGKIARISKWEKLENVETTFSGKFDLIGDITSKKKDAIKIVKYEFLEILKEYESFGNDVKIHCAMLVDGLGEHSAFEVSR